MKTEVFISHSSADRVWANALCTHLEGRKIRCWIAPRDVPPGGIWAEAIVDGIENTRVMVLLLSSHANASHQVINEVERAVSKGVIVLPVRVENVKPSKGLEFFLGSRHWLEALTPPMEQRIIEIGNQIERVLGDSPPPPPLPPPRPTRRNTWALPLAIALVILAGIGVWWWTRIKPPGTTTGGAPAAAQEVATTRPPSGRNDSSIPGAQPVARTEVTTAAPVIIAPTAPVATVDAPAAGPSPGPTLLDVVLPDTIWVGVLEDAAGVHSTCLAQVERRTGDRVTIVAYFPEESGPTPVRWTGRLTGSVLSLEGIDSERQRVSLSGGLSGGRLTGTWTNDGGRRGTFAFDPNSGTAPALVAGSTWRGSLTVEHSETIELTLRVITRQGERIAGRYAATGQRNETGFSAVLLGDRLFGMISNLPVPGTQHVQARFLAVALDNQIAGTWNSDAGLAGKVQWRLEP